MTKDLVIGRKTRKVEILESNTVPKGFNPWASTEKYLVFAELSNDSNEGPYTINANTLKAIEAENADTVVKAKIITGKKTVKQLKNYLNKKARHVELITKAIKVLEENKIEYK